eukprot:TRINITY_DN5363_c0_g1_i1.p1 TRINITY_DN5363_c0_g1~~TRINITY_DN5363_c0_g1_i1.p1  ORF type:complete len:162 (+),score=16.13 TRINITY_DN5363_c0_g1_i1:56-541(+)
MGEVIKTHICSFFFVLCLVSDFLVGFLIIQARIDENRQAECIALDCAIKNGNACNDRNLCWFPFATFEFTWNDQLYVGTYQGLGGFEETAIDFCNQHQVNTTIPCWFDQRNPSETIHLTEAENLSVGITLCVIFSIASAILLFIIVCRYTSFGCRDRYSQF